MRAEGHFPAFPYDHSLSSLLFLFQWKDSSFFVFWFCFFFLLWCQSVRRKERLACFYVHLSSLGGFVRPSFSFLEIVSVQALQSCCWFLLFVSLCWLVCVCTETNLRPETFPLMFWLCSFLSFFVLVLSGWRLGLPGHRWWRVWDKDIQ